MGIFKNIVLSLCALTIAASAMADVVVKFNNAAVFTDQTTSMPDFTTFAPQTVTVEVDGVPVPGEFSGEMTILYNYFNPILGYEVLLNVSGPINFGLHTSDFVHPNFLAENVRAQPNYYTPIGHVLTEGYFADNPNQYCRVKATRFIDNPLGIYNPPSHYADLQFVIGDSPFHPVDISHNASVSPDDIFVFMDRYVSGHYDADFNRDGQITPQDLFDFLDAYFSL